jgi:hypothetical protein
MPFELADRLDPSVVMDEKILFAEVQDGISLLVNDKDLDELQGDDDFVAELGLVLPFLD